MSRPQWLRAGAKKDPLQNLPDRCNTCGLADPHPHQYFDHKPRNGSIDVFASPELGLVALELDIGNVWGDLILTVPEADALARRIRTATKAARPA